MNGLELDRASDVPLHLQIEHLLRRMAQMPEYRGGKVLPSEVVLAEHLKVSRNTLRAAMSRLEAEGLFERTPRVGTRVMRPVPRTSLSEWYSFSQEMRKQGIAVVNYSISLRKERPAAEVAGALGVQGRQDLWRLERLRGWDDSPALLAISWLHPSLGIRGDEDFSRPLYEILREIAGVTPALSREEITAILADHSAAKALHVERGEPILLRRRTILDRKARPIEYNLNYYRTDRYSLTLDLKSPGK